MANMFALWQTSILVGIQAMCGRQSGGMTFQTAKQTNLKARLMAMDMQSVGFTQTPQRTIKASLDTMLAL